MASKRSTTTLDEHTDAPSVTVPGDGPADTTDPTQRATSVTPDKAAAVAAGHGTVNAVVPLPSEPEPVLQASPDDRYETYQAEAPDGSLVTMRHNLDTGHTEQV